MKRALHLRFNFYTMKSKNTLRNISITGFLTLLLFVAGVSVTCAALTPPGIEWEKTFGGSYNDYAYSVQQTTNGGYIVAGSTDSYGAGGANVWLIKTDSLGNEKWSRTLVGDEAHSVQQTTDGGYIVAGLGLTNGNPDALLIKTDSLGNEEWSRTFGGIKLANSVQQTTDGGYIVAGWTVSYDGYEDAWLIKTDSLGNEEWSRTFGGSNVPDIAESVQQTMDGGYILAGWTVSYDGYEDAWLIKTDSLGNEEWNRTFGGAVNEEAYSVQQTTDGGYILAGFTNSYGAGRGDAWLIKTDSLGNEEWSRTFGGSDWDCAYSVQQTTDGGYILAGFTQSYGAGNRDFLLIKVASSVSPLQLKAAELAKRVIGADYAPGGRGWSYDNGYFLGPFKIKAQTYRQEQGGNMLSGLDNPGLVYWAYNAAYHYNHKTPHGSPIEEITPASLAANEFVRQITEAELLTGDVLFLDTDQDNTIDQAAIYTGGYTYDGTINGITYTGTYNVVNAKGQILGIIPERVADLKTQPGFKGFYRLAEPKQVDIYTNEYKYKKGETIQAIVNIQNPKNTTKTYILRVGLHLTRHYERLTRQEIIVPAQSTITIALNKDADWDFTNTAFGSLVAVLKEGYTFLASDKANIVYVP